MLYVLLIPESPLWIVVNDVCLDRAEMIRGIFFKQVTYRRIHKVFGRARLAVAPLDRQAGPQNHRLADDLGGGYAFSTISKSFS